MRRKSAVVHLDLLVARHSTSLSGGNNSDPHMRNTLLWILVFLALCLLAFA